jgi:sec-independent protein translocase protein TatA
MGRPPGAMEIIVVLVIVVLLFGVGRISKVAGELGRGIKEFRKGLTEDTPEEKTEETSPKN